MQEDRIINILPQKIKKVVQKEVPKFEKLQEIRLRAGKPLLLMYQGEERVPVCDSGEAYIVSKEEIDAVLEYISRYSLYAFEEEMKQGFITIEGGHRVGIAGQAIVDKGEIRNLRYIASVNIRMSQQHTNTALAKPMKCLIFLGFLRVRESVVVGFRPHLDHLK